MWKQLVGIAIILAACHAAVVQEAADANANNNDEVVIDFDFEQNKNLTDWEEAPKERFSFFTIGNKRFMVGGLLKVNWFKAQQICAYSGLTLASISSMKDSETLKNLLLTSPVQVNDARFWLSGTELAQPGSWVWHSNGLPVTYSRWIPGKPGVWDAPCMMLNEDYETWGNLDCNAQLFFICENRCQLDSYQVPLY